jgi:hypothetical protein
VEDYKLGQIEKEQLTYGMVNLRVVIFLQIQNVKLLVYLTPLSVS